MANLTAKRMQEMEEEMNRFEEEILSTKAAEAEAAANGARHNSRKMIIGAGTFNQVQAQISGKAPPSSPATPSSRPPEEKPHVNRTVPGPPLPPPPPPPLDSRSSSVTVPSNSTMFNLRPPPPPPAFVPHQLQHRPMMPPRPPFPPRGMPPGPPCPPGMPGGNIPRHPGMMPPPPPHPNLLQRPPMPPGSFMSPPMMSMNMGNNVPFHFNQNMMQSSSTAPTTSTSTQSSNVVEKPKVVYAALPVKRVITENIGKPEMTVAPVVVEKPPERKKTRLEPAVVKKQVLPGIELNVPVEEIEAEKKLHYQVPVAPAPAPVEAEHGESAAQETSKKKEKKKKFVRMAAGTVWEDPTLAEWDQDDFRLFCGDLGNEVMDETLSRAFTKYPSFVKAKVVRDKRTNKTKGFGFVSFKDPNDFMKAMREMNGKYVGNRPIKLRKSTWRDRQIDFVKKKDKEKKKLGFK